MVIVDKDTGMSYSRREFGHDNMNKYLDNISKHIPYMVINIIYKNGLKFKLFQHQIHHQ